MTELLLSGRAAPAAVRVRSHALERLRSRFPELRKADNQTLCGMVRREVSEAMRYGRIACRAPRFLLVHESQQGLRGKRQKAKDGGRYVWTSDEQRAYVVVEDSHRVWLVVTTLRRHAEQAAA